MGWRLLTFDRPRLLAGEPCVTVDGETWDGFDADLVLVDSDAQMVALNPRPGGRQLAPSPALEPDSSGVIWQEDADPAGTIAVRRAYVHHRSAVVFDRELFEWMAVTPARSVVVKPVADPRALNAWVEQCPPR